jgi:histidinol-phosphate aminotransferase
LLERFDHVVLLRTLSKFVSLAGVRCGALIGAPEIIDYLGRVLPPYTFPTPSIEHVLAGLTGDSLALSRERVALIKSERQRLTHALTGSALVAKVYPSDANFVLVRTRDARAFAERAHRGGVLVRTFPGQSWLTDCVRVTIGRPEDNDRLLGAIRDGDATDVA